MTKSKRSTRRILITGGAGFIGSNAAHFFARNGWHVTVLDNLSREGAHANLAWLRNEHARTNLKFIKADIVKDQRALSRSVAGSDVVLHLAGQVAVTTSVQNPHLDFEQNALGTLNVLEAVRKSKRQPILLYASTNKVYGGMEEVGIRKTAKGYRYADLTYGVPETFPLDFHSPYGCSKGAADQYVRDYSRIYGLRTVVFRQSCIYGPRQFGIEDQGWVAWFAIAAICDRRITIFGDGYQVRDVLHVDDLCRLYMSAIVNIKKISGGIYNVGGGPRNILSLRQTIRIIEKELSRGVPVRYSGWRQGDQRIYISDIRAARHNLGWTPKIGAERGVLELVRWVKENAELFNK